ncbi:MAG: RNA 2',3'-cyclic phosphodiesterase [Patescibacteria group bacterium]
MLISLLPMRKHRLFIGISIPNNIKEKLLKIQDKFSERKLPLRLTDLKNIHITLNFLGYLTDREVVKIRHILDEIIPTFSIFDVWLSSFRFFPDENHIRVVAMMIENNGSLEKLQRVLSSEFAKLKFVRIEKREYKPHLTIARTKPPAIKTKEIEQIKNIKIESGKWKVKNIALIESILRRTGAQYTVLKKWDLKKENF